MPENETAWAVWQKYGWTLVDWPNGLFLIQAAIALLTMQAVDDVEAELFKVATVANVYMAEEARKRKANE